MTRKDFDLIAATLKTYRDLSAPDERGPVDAIAREFAFTLKATNKQFNSDRFLRACGVTP